MSETTQVLQVTLWKREGLSYVSSIIYRHGYGTGKRTRKLDFISYHLIRLIHGDDYLLQMARNYVDQK